MTIRALLVVAVIITLSTLAFGQTSRGTVTGTVTDPAGAVISGADVTLISGPVNVPDPPGAKVIKVESAREMLRAIAPILRGVAGYIRDGLGSQGDDVDPDAYVLHVMQMVIGAAAVGEVTAAMLGNDAEGQRRYDHELARIAKASLFGRRRRK